MAVANCLVGMSMFSFTARAVAASVELNRDRTIDLTLRYYHLTEDLETVEVKAFASIVEDYSTEQGRLLRRVAADVKKRFIKKMARHQIALRGEKGEL